MEEKIKYKMFMAHNEDFLPANAGDIKDACMIPGLGRSPGRGHGNPLHHSCLENPIDRGAGGLWSMRSQRVGHR